MHFYFIITDSINKFCSSFYIFSINEELYNKTKYKVKSTKNVGDKYKDIITDNIQKEKIRLYAKL